METALRAPDDVPTGVSPLVNPVRLADPTEGVPKETVVPPVLMRACPAEPPVAVMTEGRRFVCA
jgi:hypothetical protein